MECTVGGDGHVAVVQPAGDLDLATAPRLQRVLRELLDEGRTRILMDMGGVTFVDSSGLGILVGAYKAARARGGDVKFANASREVRKLFQITRTDRYLAFYARVEDARTAFDVS
jgi:anti-sigma B factor antagonist